MYDNGSKFAGSLFAAFSLRRTESLAGPSRIGFTAPRALGTAVMRNRIRRRMREAVRASYAGLVPGLDIVFNPRKRVAVAPFNDLTGEVRKYFERCGRS